VIGILIYDFVIGKALAARELVGAPEEAPETVADDDEL
jgi:hypothetical protein